MTSYINDVWCHSEKWIPRKFIAFSMKYIIKNSCQLYDINCFCHQSTRKKISNVCDMNNLFISDRLCNRLIDIIV